MLPDGNNGTDSVQKGHAYGATEDSINIRKAQAPDEDCMGCKLVTFLTPLVVSGYLISQTTKSKVEQLPRAVSWTGKNSWRKGAYRFAFNVAIPLGLCYWTYAYMFKFGPFRPNPNMRKPSSLEDVKEDFKNEVSQDIDSFTKGTHKLGDWIVSKLSDKTDSINDSITRAKRVLDKPTGSSDPGRSSTKTD